MLAESPTRLNFSFSLDYPKNESLQYRREDFVEFVVVSAERSIPCPTEAGKRNALADEVRGYLTMCRYLLFKLEIHDQKELDRLAAMKPEQLGKFLQEKHAPIAVLSGNANPEWVKNLLLHYFAKGGRSGAADLTAFVKDYYERNGAPGFVDHPECAK